MNFEEWAAKPLLAAAGIAVPEGMVADDADAAAAAVGRLGPSVVKAQVPTGKRGKAGGIRPADEATAARAAADAILALTIAGHPVRRLLVERRAPIARELYAAVLNDPESKGPLVLFSTEGGMDIEEVAAKTPERLRRMAVDIRHGFDRAAAQAMIAGLDLGGQADAVADLLVRLYRVWRENDAELVEINPLAVTQDGRLVALDCKFTLDDSAVPRRRDLAANGTPERLTGLEARGREAGLRFIELEGDVGLLANGAGLTMTTMDVIAHLGGRPANFLEIGGEAYTLGEVALGLVLDNPNVKSLVVNFCGAFARTDVMAEGILAAWDKLKPDLPVFFSIHGTNEDEAVALVRERLGIEPHDRMDDAIRAAIEAARGAVPAGARR
jgi:succinyl-CoA synthetase beta subunit